jgi:hypothetical protein
VEKRNYPKARFSTRLSTGEFLNVSVWQGKSDPRSEVIRVEIRKLDKDNWQSVARLAVYRSSDGNYSQLPDRKKPDTPLTSASAYDDQQE